MAHQKISSLLPGLGEPRWIAMAKSMSWYITSYEWIQDQAEKNPDLDREQLKKHCSKNYPFAMRKGYAYKAWLKAMGDYFGRKKKGPDLFNQEVK